MSTRSNIGIKNEDGTVSHIYCHFDGYLEHNGEILNEHYNTEERVKQLIELGDISYLAPEIGEQQDFDAPNKNKNWCLAYGRDRGEVDTEAITVSYVDYTKESINDYAYLYTPGRGWEVKQYGVHYWTDLTKAIEQNEKLKG